MLTHDTESRLALLDSIHLKSGAHSSWEEGVCAMEAAAFIAGEPHTDHPICVDPVIGAFMRSWNDGLSSDEDRDRLLLPLIPLTIGTAGSPELQDRRAIAVADWAVRTLTPAWLRLVPSLVQHADTLANLEPLDTIGALQAATAGPIAAARKDAAAACNAARDAAWNAAGNAARDAAWNAAWNAAGAAARDAAGDAAGDAAWNAAGAAAWNAAGDAAGDALADTVTYLQGEASQLVRDLCAMTEEA